MACRVPARGVVGYTRCYCEENVHRLITHMLQQGGSPSEWYAVFLSSLSASAAKVPKYGPWASAVPLSTGRSHIVWDYHVVGLHTPADSPPQVFDHDSELGWPVQFDVWVEKQLLMPWRVDRRGLGVRFRVCRSDEYLSVFASDRGHMKTPDGRFQSPPPPYQCIRPQVKDAPHMNLASFINMASSDVPGEVMDLPGLSAFALQPRRKDIVSEDDESDPQ
eukprot:Hpha_TRINITY_DN17706_c0_g1::TRINITY_DN17706_c0_g1_i1::g.46366::m.46366/K21286/NTAQ1; protein N-terminal glutamine amidohydrolase